VKRFHNSTASTFSEIFLQCLLTFTSPEVIELTEIQPVTEEKGLNSQLLFLYLAVVHMTCQCGSKEAVLQVKEDIVRLKDTNLERIIESFWVKSFKMA